jgi:hypothetical protein
MADCDETGLLDMSVGSTPSGSRQISPHKQPATPDVEGPAFQMEGEFNTLLNTSTYERLMEEKMDGLDLSLISNSLNNSILSACNMSMIAEKGPDTA